MPEGNAQTSTNPAASMETAENQSQPRMVPESDLLAVKAGKEGLERKLSEAETKLSTLQNQSFVAEARAKALEERLAQMEPTAKELEALKPQLSAAQKRSEELQSRALEYRKRVLAGQYGVAVDSLKDRTMEQLDAVEEALKLVGARGGGGYAAGGGSGGGSAPETPVERARRVVADAEARSGSVRVSGPG